MPGSPRNRAGDRDTRERDGEQSRTSAEVTDGSGDGQTVRPRTLLSGCNVFPVLAVLISLALLAFVTAFVQSKWKEKERPSEEITRHVLERLNSDLARTRQGLKEVEERDAFGILRIEARDESVPSIWWGPKDEEGAWPFVAVIVDANGERTGGLEGRYLLLPSKHGRLEDLTYDRIR